MNTSSLRSICVFSCALLMPIWNAAAQTAPEVGRGSAKDYSHSSVVTRMMAFDQKHEGKLTRDEITDWRFLRLFDQADSNHDGIVTREELETLASKLDVPAPQGRGGFAGPGGPGGPGGFGGPPPGDFGGPGPDHRHIDWNEKISQLDLSKLPADSESKGLTYETDIKPLLGASCTQCHGSERTRGGLRLDSLDGLNQGGDNGPAIVPGKSKESHLVIAASRIDADTAMPPQHGHHPDPTGMIANQIIRQAGANGNSTITKDQFVGLAKAWFDKADSEKTGTVTQARFVSAVTEALRPEGFPGRRPPSSNSPDRRDNGDAARPGGPDGGGPPDGGPGRPGGFGPGGPGGFNPIASVARALFNSASDPKNGSLTSAQLQDGFARLFDRWNTNKSGSLTEEALHSGLSEISPAPQFGEGRQPPSGGRGGFGGPGGPGGPGGGGPQAKPLTSEQVAILRAWIDQGAK